MFSYEQAWHRLTFVQVNGMTEDFSVKERTYLLKSMMNWNNEMQVRAAGGLLEVLQEEMLIDPIRHNDYETNMLQIHSISELSMDKFLMLDFSTYGALQIFQTDKHPSDMGIGKAKEGFSLFGIFADKCATLMGRRLLRTWFLRPLLDLDVINNRLDFITVFLNLDEIVAAFHQSLKHVKDIPRLLRRFSSPSSLSTRNDWQQLSKTISSYLHLRDIVEVGLSQRHYKPTMRKLHFIQKILSVHAEDLISLNDLITGAIDFDQTCGESSDTMIAKGVCEELDDLKHMYEGLPDFLEQVASLELKRLPKQDSGIYVGSIMYLPQIGYLMCLSGKRLELDILQDLPDFEFVFANGINDDEECFYRTSKTKELDAMLGDIHHKILDMERAILRDLELRIVSSSSSLIKMAAIAAELDCLIAFTTIARECKYVRPTLCEKNIIHITHGRHPLQELILDTFVPNDTECSNTGHINIITGPNYSGKSVYVKQVALIIFLSHIGSFVPAEEATIGLIDRIFSAVACKHTVTLQESTFMMDLHQVSIMLRNSTEKSLCILDEFGKGTLITDGVGILCSTLKYFSSSKHPPWVFACTHFAEVFDESLLPKSENIKFFTMSVLESSSSTPREGLEDIIFLYRAMDYIGLTRWDDTTTPCLDPDSTLVSHQGNLCAFQTRSRFFYAPVHEACCGRAFVHLIHQQFHPFPHCTDCARLTLGLASYICWQCRTYFRRYGTGFLKQIIGVTHQRHDHISIYTPDRGINQQRTPEEDIAQDYRDSCLERVNPPILQVLLPRPTECSFWNKILPYFEMFGNANNILTFPPTFEMPYYSDAALLPLPPTPDDHIHSTQLTSDEISVLPSLGEEDPPPS